MKIKIGLNYMKTTVVNINTDTYDEFIARPSKWGCPFIIGIHGSKVEVLQKYRIWIFNQPKLLSELPELQGRRLGCYCAPSYCHGNILAELADIPIGQAIWKTKTVDMPIDVTGVMGLSKEGKIYMRTVYGCGVPLHEIEWIN